jgi:hypothetical protein
MTLKMNLQLEPRYCCASHTAAQEFAYAVLSFPHGARSALQTSLRHLLRAKVADKKNCIIRKTICLGLSIVSFD